MLWLDYKEIGVFLSSYKFLDGKSRLLLLDTKNIIKNDIGKIGFAPVSENHQGLYCLVGDQQKINAQAISDFLGEKILSISTTQEEVFKRFAIEIERKYKTTLSSIVRKSHYYGMNSDGFEVYVSLLPVGRYYKDKDGRIISQFSEEGRKQLPHQFLFVDELKSNLLPCAMGFVREMMEKRQVKRWQDVENFSKVIFNTKTPNNNQLFELQEAIETAYAQYFNEHAQGIGDNAFQLAKRIYLHSPTFKVRTSKSISLQQYSTPIPLSLIAQRLLLGTDKLPDGVTILEPTAGNGSLVNAIPENVRICAVEIDPFRAKNLASGNSRIEVASYDSTSAAFQSIFDVKDGFDYTIANPPFGAMKEDVRFDKLARVTKIDHLITLRTLAARKDQGRSVFILGADSNKSNGEIRGGSTFLMNYLHDHYELLGEVELDGRLYAKQGSNYNVRLIVVGNRRTKPLQEGYSKEKLQIISDYDELSAWSEKIIQSYPLNLQDNLLSLDKEEITIDASPLVSEKTAKVRNEQGQEQVPKETAFTNSRNEYQSPYIPASKVSESSTMIPINMASSTLLCIK